MPRVRAEGELHFLEELLSRAVTTVQNLNISSYRHRYNYISLREDRNAWKILLTHSIQEVTQGSSKLLIADEYKANLVI